MPLAGNGPESKRSLADHCRFGRLDPAYDEGNQVGRHLHGIGEKQHLFPTNKRFGSDHAVGNSGQGWIDDQRGGKDGFKVRLIPAGKGSAGISGLELCRRHIVCCPILVFVGAAIEATELVVEGA